jgi:phospholipid transport system substrate-binding protein
MLRKVMTSFHRPLVVAALVVVLAGLAGFARAGVPTDQLHADIDQLYQVFEKVPRGESQERESAQILDRMFDWPRMAEASLKQYWPARTPAERAEFTALFSQLFRRAYVSRIHVVDASKFRYLGDEIDKDRAAVKTEILTKKGSTLKVDYAMRLEGDRRWRIDDVRVESMSLVENYRSQFHAVIGRSSYESFIAKLRDVAK